MADGHKLVFPPTFPHAYRLTLNYSQIYFSHDSSQPNPSGPWISENKDNNMHSFFSVLALLIQQKQSKNLLTRLSAEHHRADAESCAVIELPLKCSSASSLSLFIEIKIMS